MKTININGPINAGKTTGSDLIIDNSSQTPRETLRQILLFWEKTK